MIYNKVVLKELLEPKSHCVDDGTKLLVYYVDIVAEIVSLQKPNARNYSESKRERYRKLVGLFKDLKKGNFIEIPFVLAKDLLNPNTFVYVPEKEKSN